MKKNTYILIALFVISTGVYAQGQMDALRFSQGDIFGTARAMGMAGAYGALGNDQTGVSINPAGIAMYQRNEIVGTFQFMENTARVGDETRGRGTFDLPNFGFVAYFPLRSHSMPFINVGLTSNRTQSFNRRVSAIGNHTNSRLIDFIAFESNYFGLNEFDLEFRDGHNTWEQPWLSVLGYNSWLINQNANGRWTPINTGEQVWDEIQMRESGFIDNFGFTLGTTINNVLSIGASLTVTTVSYRLDSYYHEDFIDNGRYGGYTLRNMLTTDGAGIDGRFGVIFRPIHELRIGVSYHTPTRFALRETFGATMIDEMTDFIIDDDPTYEKGRTDSPIFGNEFDLRTPGKWVFSVAGILGDLIISADYEITNFRNVTLFDSPHTQWRYDRYRFEGHNNRISEDFRTASTLRLGLDYRITPQLSVRAGYAWMQNPNNDAFRNYGDPMVTGSNTIFMVQGDAHMFTTGLGYWFNRNFFLDFALVYRTQNNELFAFPNVWEGGNLEVAATPFDMRNTSLRGVLTLGYRF